MKRILLSGVAIAACFGLATTALAQYGSNYQYSSYGYGNQTQTQEGVAPAASPSDAPAVAPAPPAAQAAPAALNGAGCGTSAGCDSSGYFGNGCDGRGGGGYGLGAGCGGGCGLAGGCGGGCGLGGCGTGNLVGSSDRNIVVGLRGLWFERNYENHRGLGSNAAGQYLFTTDSDHDYFGGAEFNLGVRNCSGSGWEFGYWGLYPDESDVTFANPPLYSTLTGLSAVNLGGNSVLDILNTSDNWRLYRNSEIQNVELNLLRNGGQVQSILGGCANIEWIAGIRWLKFTEDMRLSASNSLGGAYPALTNYNLDVENNMAGFQLGARIERCLNACWTVSLGTKFGVYNNDIYARQSIQDNLGNYALIGASNYIFGGTKDDVATLGELDLGLNYQVSSCLRVNFGYRAIGVSGVALTADQIPNNFTDGQDIARINSSGNLLLQGFYFGAEKSF